jgi:hypothetical protein
MTIDFSKLAKHTEYTLSYEINNELVFTITPKMGARKAFMVAYKQIMDSVKGETDLVDTKPFQEFLLKQIIETSTTPPTPQEVETLKGFIEEYDYSLLEQTSIGFKITNKEDIDANKKKAMDSYLSKKQAAA